MAEQAQIVHELRAEGLGPGGFYNPSFPRGGCLHFKMMCLGG